MRTLILLVFIIISGNLTAQDYFAVVTMNDNTTMNYPPTVTMTLVNHEGEEQQIKKDDAVDVTGYYTLKVNVPWSEEPEIIKSEGGRLEIFILPTDIRKRVDTEVAETAKYESVKLGSKPALVRKELFKSEENKGEYDLLLVFDNGITYRIFDGKVRAWKDGDEMEISDKNFVATEEGILKVSFNPATAETWWVWANK